MPDIARNFEQRHKKKKKHGSCGHHSSGEADAAVDAAGGYQSISALPGSHDSNLEFSQSYP